MRAEQIQPTGGRVLVRKLPDDEDKGIYVGDVYGGLQRGIVLAVGPGDISATGQLVEPRVKQGDEVLFLVADEKRTKPLRTEDTKAFDTYLLSEREICARLTE